MLATRFSSETLICETSKSQTLPTRNPNCNCEPKVDFRACMRKSKSKLEGTYCVWTPRTSAQSSPNCVKIKSNSTGSCSKRWRFCDLLKRSNSDGKDLFPSFVFLTPSSSKKSGDGELRLDRGRNNHENDKKVNVREAFYVSNRALKEGGKKRSYLPYRKDLVGFFANVNGLGKSFPPF